MYEVEFHERLIESMPNLRHYAYKFTCAGDEVDELMQETMLKALMNSEKFRREESFNGWLAVIMRNTYLNMAKPRSVSFTGYDACCDKGYADSSFDYRELRKIVRSLPDELYIPFNMHVSGVAYKSIADRLGLPIGTVKSRIHIARKRLKVMLRSCLNFIGK